MGLWGVNTRERGFSQVRTWVNYLHLLPRCQQQWGSVVCWLSNKNKNKNKPLKTRSKRSDSCRCFIFRKTKHTRGRTWANARIQTDYSLPFNLLWDHGYHQEELQMIPGSIMIPPILPPHFWPCLRVARIICLTGEHPLASGPASPPRTSLADALIIYTIYRHANNTPTVCITN